MQGQARRPLPAAQVCSPAWPTARLALHPPAPAHGLCKWVDVAGWSQQGSRDLTHPTALWVRRQAQDSPKALFLNHSNNTNNNNSQLPTYLGTFQSLHMSLVGSPDRAVTTVPSQALAFLVGCGRSESWKAGAGQGLCGGATQAPGLPGAGPR